MLAQLQKLGFALWRKEVMADVICSEFPLLLISFSLINIGLWPHRMLIATPAFTAELVEIPISDIYQGELGVALQPTMRRFCGIIHNVTCIVQIFLYLYCTYISIYIYVCILFIFTDIYMHRCLYNKWYLDIHCHFWSCFWWKCSVPGHTSLTREDCGAFRTFLGTKNWRRHGHMVWLCFFRPPHHCHGHRQQEYKHL